MRWVTKNSLRCDLARLQAQLEGMTIQLRQREEYIAKLERLVDKERDRIDAERNRSDRATDALLQQNGVAAITDLGVETSEASKEAADEEMKGFRERMGNMYAESFDDIESDEMISSEVRAVLTGIEEVIS